MNAATATVGEQALAQVSVIIPVYNSEGTLSRAISSAVDQTLTDLEVIVVVDGSKDNSLGIAKGWAERDGRVKVLDFAVNRGKSACMNDAIALAKGEWVAVLDADDRYLPNRLEVLYAEARDRAVDLVADNQIHVDAATGKAIKHAFQPDGDGRSITLRNLIENSSTQVNFSFGILKTFVKTRFVREKEVHYISEAKLGEDYYYLLEFLLAGGRAWLTSDALYEWTLPFSPTTRRWTSTGNGAWRYDYENALAVNQALQQKYLHSRAEISAILKKQESEYRIMIRYLRAQRLFEEDRRYLAAGLVVLGDRRVLALFSKRVRGRIRRFFAREV